MQNLKQPFIQTNENDPVKLVIIHQPRYEIFIAKHHPASALWEDSTAVENVAKNFDNLKNILKSNNIKILTVRECLKMDRESLKSFATKCLVYEADYSDVSETKLTTESDFLKYYVSNEYKDNVINKLNDDELVDIILTNPTYKIVRSSVNTFVDVSNISHRPVSNLLFTRDQQITTQKGVILGRSHAKAREIEHVIMRQVFKNLGASPIDEMPEEHYLEGGDFMILKNDIALLGVGLRTTMNSARYLMEKDLLGTDRFGLVVDDTDLDQQRMHLDTFFNIINKEYVLALDFLDVPIKKVTRKVQVYSKNGNKKEYGDYSLVKEYDDFYEFFFNEGFKLVKVTHQQQCDYMINFLNIGNNSLIAVNRNLKKVLGELKVDVKVIDLDFDSVIKMYGAVHCCSQVARSQYNY